MAARPAPERTATLPAPAVGTGVLGAPGAEPVGLAAPDGWATGAVVFW